MVKTLLHLSVGTSSNKLSLAEAGFAVASLMEYAEKLAFLDPLQILKNFNPLPVWFSLVHIDCFTSLTNWTGLERGIS